MGERPSRGGSHRNGELCAGKTSRISSVRVCGWIHSESPAARQSSEWFLATAYLRIKTSDFDLWSRQAVSGGPGRIAIFVGRSPRRAPTSSFGLQRRCRLHLFVQCETDFQGHLPFADFTLVDVSAGLAHLEPPHVANRLLGARQCILYSLFESVRRRTNYFNLFVNVIGHTLIISRGNNRTNKKPCAGSGRRAAPAGRRCAARLLISNFALQAHLNSGSLAVCENRWQSRY